MRRTREGDLDIKHEGESTFGLMLEISVAKTKCWLAILGGRMLHVVYELKQLSQLLLQPRTYTA
jgi:hypothetical protein